MLKLKCNICLDKLETQERGPVAAPCGHIYCQDCLDAMSRTRETTNCAFCRHPFHVAGAIRLFVEYEESQPDPVPPLTVSQTEAGNAFIEACAHVGEDAGEEETLQTIVSAEKILMAVEETHGNTDAEKLLKLISAGLGDLRKRLKLFSRMNALQQEKASLEQERDSLRQAVVEQLKEADEAAHTQTKLTRRLKRTSSELEVYQTRQRGEQQASSRAVQELTAELQTERANLAKYKKKYYATLQKLKATKPRPENPVNPAGPSFTPETELSDESLEIISPPGSQVPSKSVIKASLRRQMAGSPPIEPPGDLKGKRKVIDSAGARGAGPSHKRVKPPPPALDMVIEDSVDIL